MRCVRAACLGDERQKHFSISSHPHLDKVNSLDSNWPALLNALQGPENAIHSVSENFQGTQRLVHDPNRHCWIACARVVEAWLEMVTSLQQR